MKKSDKQGFTLIELAIVLVIIGVLVGSVIIGKTLIESSKLQTVITDADSYTSAVNNFKQAYQSLPGDFSNAQGVWGSLSSLCHTASDKTNGTCNGNGNGQITGNGSGGAATANNAAEIFLFWQHLNRAGMLPQSLSGAAGAGGGSAAIIGTNTPAGSIKGSGFSVIWYGDLTTAGSCGSAQCFAGNYGNVLVFGASSISGSYPYIANDITYKPILMTEQAQYIDTKIDDGNPTSGKIRSYSNASSFSSCTNGSIYNLTNTTRSCSLIFLMGF